MLTETSSAWLGPLNTPILAVGNSSNNTSSNVFNVSFSNPLEHIITGFSPIYCLYCLKIFLVNLDGVACKMISASSITSLKSVRHLIFSGILIFGKNLHFLSSFINLFSSSSYDHIFT